MEVVNEVKRVMSGKGLPQKRKSFNDSCCSNFSVDRRSKKKKKIALNYCTSKGAKKKSAPLKRKLVVFKYMPGKDGKGPPEHFTRKEEYILVNGMIQFHVDDDESAIRSKIVSVISTTKDPDLLSIAVDDFEFISMIGKHASVSHHAPDYQYTGQAVKQLTGSGSLYVRLVRDWQQQVDKDLPFINSPYTPRSTMSSDLEWLVDVPNVVVDSTPEQIELEPDSSLLQSCPEPLIDLTEALDNSSVLQAGSSTSTSLPEAPPAFVITHELYSVEEDMAFLAKKFPGHHFETLHSIYELSEHDFALTVQTMESGPTAVSLLQLVKSKIIKYDTADAPKIRVDKDDEASDYLESALSFYKGPKFSSESAIRLLIHGEPAIDSGGVRRHFFKCIALLGQFKFSWGI